MNSRISCCMIVKDEERFIKGCLSSIIREVDEIILVDTGSSDKTIDIARNFGEKIKIFGFEWNNDFSEARNFSLSRATGDWILYLDADERLNTMGLRNILRLLAEKPDTDAYTSMIRNFSLQESGSLVASIGYVVRFFRNMEGLRFEGAVHEQIIPSLKRLNARIEGAPFIIDHLGYNLSPEEWHKKLERNINLSLKELKKNPEDTRILYHLALSWYLMRKSDKAWEYVERAYRSIRRNHGEQVVCGILNLKAKMLLEQKQFEKALSLADISLKIQSKQSTAYLIKGASLYFLGRSKEAIPFVKKTLEYQELMGNPLHHPSRLSHEFIMPLSEIRRLLANCYFSSNMYREALSIVEQEIAEDSKSIELIRFALVCALRSDMWDKAESLLRNYCGLTDGGRDLLPFFVDLLRDYSKRKDIDRIVSFLDVISRSGKEIEYLGFFLDFLRKVGLLDRVFEECKKRKLLSLLEKLEKLQINS